MSGAILEDRLAIRELIEMSVVGVMRMDADIWGATWAEDGRWKIDAFDQPIKGRDAIVEVYRSILAKIEAVTMISFPTELRFDGRKAQGKAYSQEIVFPKAGGQRMLVGCFHDDYVQQDGRWLFQSRRYETLLRKTVAT